MLLRLGWRKFSFFMGVLLCVEVVLYRYMALTVVPTDYEILAARPSRGDINSFARQQR